MSELAKLHLTQAAQLARAGDVDRAIELLEKARVLAAADKSLLARVLAQLAPLYERGGRAGEAGLCRAELARIKPEPVQRAALTPPRPAMRARRRRSPLRWIVGVSAALALLAIVGFAIKWLIRTTVNA